MIATASLLSCDPLPRHASSPSPPALWHDLSHASPANVASPAKQPLSPAGWLTLQTSSTSVGSMEWEDYPRAGSPEIETTGTLKVARIESPQLGNERDIVVYLPPSYPGNGRRYPVVYMHDGQNLFDDLTSFAGAWHVAEAMENASRKGLEALIVGIYNMGGERCDEYSPWADAKNGGGRGDLYLDFIIQTLKPVIDADFSTNPSVEATGIAGSSMGGLISLYGLFRNPETFGYAGAMSPAFWFADRTIYDFVEAAPRVGRIYVDVGTREGQTELDDVQRMCELLRRKGYREGRDLLCVVERGGHHREAAWARRLPRKIRFFLRHLAQERPAAGGAG